MKRESIHSGQRVRYSDGKPSGVWTVVAIEEQVVLQAASGRRLAQADELQPADVAEEQPLPVEDAPPAPPLRITDLRDLERMVDGEEPVLIEVTLFKRLLTALQEAAAMQERLEDFAGELENDDEVEVHWVAYELRNRMRGAK